MQILKDIVDVIPPQSFLLTYSRARARLRFKVRVMVRKNVTIRRAKVGGRAARRGAGRAVRRGGWTRTSEAAPSTANLATAPERRSERAGSDAPPVVHIDLLGRRQALQPPRFFHIPTTSKKTSKKREREREREILRAYGP